MNKEDMILLAIVVAILIFVAWWIETEQNKAYKVENSYIETLAELEGKVTE